MSNPKSYNQQVRGTILCLGTWVRLVGGGCYQLRFEVFAT
jgi:hypothetical protein